MQATPRTDRMTVQSALGAYGLRLSGVPEAEYLLAPANADWPRFDVVVEVGSGDPGAERVDASLAHVRLRTGGWIDIDRIAGRAHFTVPAPLSADELVHPFLAPVAAVTAHWFGRESFHGGGIVLGDMVWGVLGDRNDGKSSLLAALSARGVHVVCDDVLVVEETTAFAGPRTIDLQDDAAEALSLGERIGVAGARERWRLRLPPVPPTLPLAGWVLVGWGAGTEVRRLTASETLPSLIQHRGISIPPTEPAAFLQLSALPAWEFRRSRSWEAMPEALDRLLTVLGA